MAYDNFFNSDYMPPTAFYFAVKFAGFPDMDCSFQEVSGLKVTVGTVEKKEGGGNDFVHHVPTPPKFENLVLKRCSMINAALEKWCQEALEDFKFNPRNLQVALLVADGQILASWMVEKAFPISWELSTLNSTSNQLAIETLTLKYRQFKREI